MFNKKQFLDINGNFNSKPFMDILNDAQYAIKTGKKPTSKIKKEVNQIILGGINPKEVRQFINKLGNFLNSGIDLKTAFGILTKQVKNPKLRQITNEVKTNLDHGLSISDTLKQYAKYFDPLIIALIEVGEKTGSLPKVLVELDKKLLETIELKAKIKGAMIYPVILIFITICMVIFMLVFILPKITESFKKTGVKLPALTQFLINASDFLINNYLFLVPGVVGLGIFYVFFKSTYIGRMVLDKIALHIPVFGYITKQSNVILFISSFGLLLDAGVLILEAIEITSNVVNNIYFKKDIIRIKNEVETGVKLSNAMGLNISNKEMFFSNPYFPEELVHMISIGEETGTIGKSIEKVGVNFTNELKRFISNLMSMLEPFIIVFVGAVVGTIVIAIMLPFFNLAKVAKKM